MVQIFHHGELVKTHVRRDKGRATDVADYPPVMWNLNRDVKPVSDIGWGTDESALIGVDALAGATRLPGVAVITSQGAVFL